MGVLNWSNALSTAGGATAQLGLEGVRATLEQQKIQLASDLAEKRQIGAEQRAPAVAAATTTATADATAASTIKNAPGLLNVETTRARAINEENTRAELDRFKQLAPAKRQEAIDTEVEKVKALATPDMLEAAKKIKLANHIVDPSYTLVPNADGTVTTFDVHSGKSLGALKDADGNPIVRKDPEEMKAAVAVINMANTNLKIAEAAYKADSVSLEPGVKEKATVAWNEAQKEAKSIAAPAYAVLYSKAKIPGVDSAPAPAGKTGWDNATGDVWKDGAKIGTAKSAAAASTMIHAPAAVAAPAPAAEPGLINRPTSPQERREAEMRAEYDAEQAKKKVKEDAYQQNFKDNITRTGLMSGM